MTRQSLAASFAPIFLRLVLGVIFLRAGLVKVMEKIDYSGEDAVLLAKWGVAPGSDAAAGPTAVPVPDAKVGSTPAPASESTPPENPSLPTTPPAPNTPTDPATPAAPTNSTTPPEAQATTSTPAATVRAMTLYSIATMVHHAANPAPKADGTAGKALAPSKAAEGKAPVILAWTATITELAGGILVLIGFMTRLMSLGFACTMGVAMWLTQIGPAIAAGTAKFGFIPAYGPFDPQWGSLFLQFALLGSSLALLFAGAGMLSLDRLLFEKPVVVIKTPVANPTT
ncbi:MAG: DoxX family membrane protein [Phycisphaerales bacterium]|nr:DoxX family membrane protein [Phycisphaerales bacterium]